VAVTKKLKDLKIKSVSLVSNKARPVNQYSKLTFVKSKKEEKNMTFQEFMEAAYKKFGYGNTPSVDTPALDVTKAEVSDQKADTLPEFVTKAEFDTQLKTLGDKIDKLTDVLTKGAEVEKAEKENTGKFIADFAEMYKQDREALKAEIAEEIVKAKRAISPVQEQPSLEELVKKSLHPDSLFGFGNKTDKVMEGIVNKGITDGKYKVNSQPMPVNSALQAFRDLMNCNMTTGGI
jgi:hypothetical protein